MSEANAAYEKSTSEVQDLESQLSDCNKQLAELKNTPGIDLVNNEQINKLSEQRDILQQTLDLKKEENRINALKTGQQSAYSYGIGVKSQYKKDSDGLFDNISATEEMNRAFEEYKNWEQSKKENEEDIADTTQRLSKITNTQSSEYKKLSERLERLSQPYHCSGGGSCKLYTPEQMSAIYVAEKMNTTAQTTYFNQLKEMITDTYKSENDVDVVLGVTWGTPLSGKYLDNYNLIMAQSNLIVKAVTKNESKDAENTEVTA